MRYAIIISLLIVLRAEANCVGCWAARHHPTEQRNVIEMTVRSEDRLSRNSLRRADEIAPPECKSDLDKLEKQAADKRVQPSATSH